MLVVCDVLTQSVKFLRRILQQLNMNEATSTGQYPHESCSTSSCTKYGSRSPSFEGRATECAVNKHREGTQPLKIPVALLRHQ